MAKKHTCRCDLHCYSYYHCTHVHAQQGAKQLYGTMNQYTALNFEQLLEPKVIKSRDLVIFEKHDKFPLFAKLDSNVLSWLKLLTP
jgi:hypothetical protein